MSVAPSQRFTARHPCPICGGHAAMPQGQGRRCFGFVSDDGRYGHCTREEHAGELGLGPDGAFAHGLSGPCNCGVEHGPPPAAPARANGTARRIVRETVYRVGDFEHLRHDREDGSKRFFWRQLDGTPSLGGVPVADLPLYGVEALADALAGSTVLVVEGEKARDVLAARGVLAVGTVCGAKAYPSEASLEALRGFDVVLWPDRDADGNAHMGRIAGRLQSMGIASRTFTWAEAPTRGDAADFFELGGTPDELRPLIENSVSRFTHIGNRENRVTKFSLTPLGELLDEPAEAIPWVVDAMLPAGGVSVVVAKPKVGKSTLARNLALAAARGDPFFGRETSRGSVVYLALEDKRAEVRAHFERMGALGDEPVFVHVGVAPEAAIDELRRVIADHRPVLAIIDPLFRFVRIGDISAYAELTRALEPVITLARESGVHILAVHHAPKSEREGGDNVLGSTAIFGAVDTALILRRRSGVRVLESSQRYGTDLPETVVAFDPDTGRISPGGELSVVQLAETEQKILDALGDGEEQAEAEIRERVGGNESLAAKALRALVAKGELQRSGRGRRGDPYKYIFSQPSETSAPEMAVSSLQGAGSVDSRPEVFDL